MNSTPEQSIENGSQGKEDNDSIQEIPNSSATTSDFPEFGWSAYAERINGRFAMVGFIAILMIEAVSKSSFLQWAGIISR